MNLREKTIDPQTDSFNQRVMVALIQEDYLQKLMSRRMNNQNSYPKFLTSMLSDD